MLNELQHVFIDEFGNPNLNTEKQGATEYFIIVATLVSNSEILSVQKSVEELAKKHFQGSEIKSSNVRKDRRRTKILKDITELNVNFYAVVINKAAVSKNGGLIYKQPFMKFINGILYRKIFDVFPNVKMFADEHGYPEFMVGFKKYVEKNHISDLFGDASFEFQDSKENRLIQISDFIAGTLARVIEPDKISEKAERFLEIINKQIISIDEWPIKGRSYSGKLGFDSGTEFDETIRLLSIRQAAIFIEKYSSSKDAQTEDQIEVIKYLLYRFKFIDPHEYIYGGDLLKVCKSDKTIHYLRSAIIAKLRDEGVIISSSSKGYKISANSEDLFTYIDHTHSIIYPMLLRLDNAYKKFQLASKNEIDILDTNNYRYLKMAIEAIGDQKS